MNTTLKFIAAYVIMTGTSASFSHVVLSEPAALANTSYRATFRIGHGCNGSPTTAIRVRIPTGFQGTKPMPHAGWVLAVKQEDLAVPYPSHGKTISRDVTEISWTAASKDHALPDAHYDEFVLHGGVPAQGGALWFKVLQSCESGSNDWSDVPASGTSTQGLKSPAALLEIIPSDQEGHRH